MNHKLVSQVPLFSEVPRRHHKTVAAHVDEIDVPAGKVLVREGRYAGEIFVILEGGAQVAKGSSRVANLGPGQFFGELGVFDGPTRSATVVARSPMRLLVVGAREAKSLAQRFPSIDRRVRAAAAVRTEAAAA